MSGVHPNPFGREYSDAEVAAAKRLGMAEHRKDFGEKIPRLRGTVIYASGPYWPDHARRLARDWGLVSAAMDREWQKQIETEGQG